MKLETFSLTNSVILKRKLKFCSTQSDNILPNQTPSDKKDAKILAALFAIISSKKLQSQFFVLARWNKMLMNWLAAEAGSWCGRNRLAQLCWTALHPASSVMKVTADERSSDEEQDDANYFTVFKMYICYTLCLGQGNPYSSGCALTICFSLIFFLIGWGGIFI